MLTDLLAVIAGATSKTDAADDGDNNADSQQDDDGQEKTEVRIPHGSFRLRDWLRVSGCRLRNQRINNEWKTHLQCHRSTHKCQYETYTSRYADT